MNRQIIDLWADIGTEEYWDNLPVYKNRQKVDFEEIYIPFDKRWPQPGFIGKRYFKLPKHRRVVVIGQNPGVPSKKQDLEDDEVMFGSIRNHSKERSSESLTSLFSVMRKFMLGTRPGRNPWGPIRDVCMCDYIGLKLDDIAYLNLIPLTTKPKSNGDERIDLVAFGEAYKKSTKLQLKFLKPDKILFFGKGPYDQFKRWDDEYRKWDFKYVKRSRGGRIEIDDKRLAKVKKWLKS